MKRLLAATLLAAAALTICAGPAGAQGRFLDPGTNGALMAAGFGVGEDYTVLAASLGYSVGAVLDVGLNIARSSFDDEVIGRDGSANEYSPFLTWRPLRPSGTSRIGAEISASYSTASFSSDDLDLLGIDMDSDGFTAGVTLYAELESSPTLMIYPAFSVGYVDATTEADYPEDDTAEEDFEEVMFGLSVDMLFNRKVTVTPSFQTMDGESLWGISVGLLVPGT